MTLAVVLILISTTLRLGQYVKVRGQIQLTQSMLAVIDTALQQYHTDHGAFPFKTDRNNDGVSDVYDTAELAIDIGGTVNPMAIFEYDGNGDDWPVASNLATFWFLYRSANSRQIIDAITPSLVASNHPAYPDDPTRRPVATIGSTDYDLPRFVDAWGMSVRYQYVPTADSFPQVISAGPDKVFGTPDDIENK